ncbi:MAG: hypothetical protein SWY16_10825 [Cyanobacteriota bacterium]|nr:hypothetical protein [Cyanobacteriota bacterium]
MKNSRKINSISEYLKKDPDRARIKKLIFCACRNQWENNLSVLDRIEFSTLLAELYASATSLQQLNSTFIKIVEKINKRSMYFMLANKTLKSLRLIYLESYSPLNKVHIYLKKNNQKIKYQNLFNLHFLVDLKFTISRKTSLNQAKSLIYSALYYKFSYTTQSLNLLNQQEFDELVKSFLYDCDTIEDIEFRLQGAAHYLNDSQKNIEVANTIVRSIQRFYDYLRQQDRDNMFTIAEIEEDEDEETLSLLPSDLESETERVPDVFSAQFLTSEIHRDCFDSSNNNGQPTLENNLQDLTHQKVESIDLKIADILKELETDLERFIEDNQSDRYLALKYKVLRDFILGLQNLSTKYWGFLQTSEENDRQKLSASSSPSQEP